MKQFVIGVAGFVGTILVFVCIPRLSGTDFKSPQPPRLEQICDLKTHVIGMFSEMRGCWSSESLWIPRVLEHPDGERVFAIVERKIALFDENKQPSEWSEVYSGDYGLSDLVFVSSNLGFAVGSSGNIVKTVDGGVSWRRIATDSHLDFSSVSFQNERIGYVAGGRLWINRETDTTTTEAGIYRTEDGGETWLLSYYDKDEGITIFDVKSIGDASAIAVINGRYMIRTVDQGKNWSRVETKGLSAVNCIEVLPDGTIWAVSNRGDFVSSADGGASWVSPGEFPEELRGDDWQSVSFSKDGFGLAVSQHGNVVYSTDYGRAWKKLSQLEERSPYSVGVVSRVGLIKSSVGIYRIRF